MDESEVQKEFPGLYTGTTKSSKKEDPEGNKKKKDKDKDRGYATLAGGESSPDEDDTKSPSKSGKRIKAFKFPLKKEKEKRDKDQSTSSTKKEKKKTKAEQCIGDVQPVFGVPLSISVQRSRCHDSEMLPLVVRHTIELLYSVPSHQYEGLFRTEPSPKDSKVQQYRRLYNNREPIDPSEIDTQTAASLLKMYLNELPGGILTTELISQFEEVSAISDTQEQEQQLRELVSKLPTENQVLLKWISLHFDAVTDGTGANAQSLAVLLSPILQTSHRLFTTILCHCRSLFLPKGVNHTSPSLPRYVPPLSGANPTLPDTREGILNELKKQESLLTQVHSDMNSGFVTKRLEEQLWDVQRIITQLNRQLRQFDKRSSSTQRSIDDAVDGAPVQAEVEPMATISAPVAGEDEAPSLMATVTETGFLELPAEHPDARRFHALQLENFELQRLKQKLQRLITEERAGHHHLKQQLAALPDQSHIHVESVKASEAELVAQNAYLEAVSKLLCNEIMLENKKIVDLRVKLLVDGNETRA